jgi:hypothetical protein
MQYKPPDCGGLTSPTGYVSLRWRIWTAPGEQPLPWDANALAGLTPRRYLRSKRLLLVLDGLDVVPDAGLNLVELLRSAPGV